MAVPIVYILLGLLAGHHLKKLIRKHLNIKDFETELGQLVLEVVKAREDGKITLKEAKDIWKEAKEAGLAKLLDIFFK